MVNHPEKGEYSLYFSRYVTLIPEGNIISILSRQIDETLQLLENITEKQGQFRYASGKWSLKEVLGHMIDTEQIMAYRLLSIARGETLSLPGFDQDNYVAHSAFNQQSIEQLLSRFSLVRQSTLLLLNSLDTNSWIRIGLVSNNEMSVRALSYVIAGHELHHRQIIKDHYINFETFPI